MCHNVELDLGICSAIIAENPHLVVSKNQSAISMENGYQKIKSFRVILTILFWYVSGIEVAAICFEV
jgi:hypothetical protein